MFLNHASGSVVRTTSRTGGVGVAGIASRYEGIAVKAQTDGHHSTFAVKATSDPEGIAIDAGRGLGRHQLNPHRHVAVQPRGAPRFGCDVRVGVTRPRS